MLQCESDPTPIPPACKYPALLRVIARASVGRRILRLLMVRAMGDGARFRLQVIDGITTAWSCVQHDAQRSRTPTVSFTRCGGGRG